jgi:hypothetical protein
MATNYLEYQPSDGYIHNWLVAGPETTPVNAPNAADWQAEAAARLYEAELPLNAEPVDRAKFAAEGARAGLMWKYQRVPGDHLVDASIYARAPLAAQMWAYTGLDVKKPGPVTLALSVYGPADLWLNGEQVSRVDGFSSTPRTTRIAVELKAKNALVVRCRQAGQGPLPLAFALRLEEAGAVGAVKVRVATPARYPRRHVNYEEAFQNAFLENVNNHRGAHFNLRFSQAGGEEMMYAYMVTDANGMIYVEGTGDVDPEKVNDVGHTFRLYERPYNVTLRAPGKEYWDQSLRYELNLPIYVLDNAYSTEPSGSLPARRDEALADAAKREGSLYAEMAKMATEKWSDLNPGVFDAAIADINSRAEGYDLELLALVGIAYRYFDSESFPAGLKAAAETCLASAGAEVAPGAGQSTQIVLLAAAALAAQRAGAENQAQVEAAVVDWLRARGANGFIEWDSPVAFERITAALTHLTSLSDNEELGEIAAVLLDKLLFLMAVNSFQGGLSGTHGSTQPEMIRSTQLQATSGIFRLLWGVGVFNPSIAGAVSLALAQYEFPSFFTNIATGGAGTGAEFFARERHAADGVEVNKVAYRTPDYLLSSVQDYHPGEMDASVHCWQATLGPDAVVFSNAPACFRHDRAYQPGFWLGNSAMPRVAQWKDALIAVYQLPDDAWLDFTHAFFPVYEFDEYALEDGWAFGRKGSGYVALTAANGFDLVGSAPDGQRELRSPGRQNTWLCQMGRVETDGNFRQFCDKVKAQAPAWQAQGVQYSTLRGETLTFGWEGPLRVDGREEALAGFKHIENPYCTADLPATQLEVGFGDLLLQLNFE